MEDNEPAINDNEKSATDLSQDILSALEASGLIAVRKGADFATLTDFRDY
jgi:hypothetical protein